MISDARYSNSNVCRRLYTPVKEMRDLIKSMRRKGAQFDHVVKMGRTQLQDAVPMTLGQDRALTQHHAGILLAS